MGSKPSESKTVSTQELSNEQQQLIGLVTPTAKKFMKTPLELYPGSAVADPTSMQQEGRGMVQQAATGSVQDIADSSINTARRLMLQGGSGALSGAGTLAGAGEQGASGIGRALSEYDSTQGARDFLASGSLLDPNTNPILGAQTEAAIRPITENLQEKILPGLRSTSLGNGMFGGSRQGIAEGRAVGDYLKTAGDISTNLQANNFNQGLGAMLATTQGAREGMSSATGQGLQAGASGTDTFTNLALRSLMEGGNLSNLAFKPGMTLEAIGSLERAENQEKLSEKANRFTTEQMLPFMQAQDVANLAFGLGGGSATTTATQSGGGGVGQTVAGLGQLALMLGMMA